MPLYVDTKYVTLVGQRLDRFVKKNKNVWNCRCPFCGDSKKNKFKARGYFYEKGGSMFYICYNCHVSTTLKKCLKMIDHSLYSQYNMESYAETHGKKHKVEDRFEEARVKPVFNIVKKKILLPSVASLDDDHVAKLYLRQRQIPEDKLKGIFYTQDFKKFVDDTCPQSNIDNVKKLKDHDQRIVFPFFNKDDKLLGFQGRALDKNAFMRYVTIKVDDSAIKLFGLDRVDFSKTVYVVEGPIDSLFLDNCIAVMDGALYRAVDMLGDELDYVFVYDNEPRNAHVVSAMRKTIKENFKIVIFPSNITQKDINDMVLDGVDVKELIDKHTYSGPMANLMLGAWTK